MLSLFFTLIKLGKNKQLLKIFFYLIIFSFGCVGSLLLPGLFSSCGEQGPLFRCGVQASQSRGFSCCRAQAGGHSSFSSCSRRAQKLWWPLGSRAQAQSLWPTGLVVPWHVGFSWIRDWTPVSCSGRQILYHWTTSLAPQEAFFKKN